jgi:hypothetical protein
MAFRSKTCSGCSRELQLDQFRKRRKGSDARESRCRDCHRDYMRWYRSDRRRKVLNAFAREIKWRTNETTLTALSAHLIRRFGGVENFVREWREEVGRMAGTKQALDSYLAILRLVETAARQKVKRSLK